MTSVVRSRWRLAGRWLGLTAMVGATAVGLAPTAPAYTGGAPTIELNNCTATAAGQLGLDPFDVPTVAFGASGQAAGCWVVRAQPGQAWQNGDQLVIAVDDNDGNDPLTAPGQVRFSSPPTVRVGGQALSNVTLLDGGRRLQVTVTGLATDTHADMFISDVRYDVDFKTSPTAYGPVDVAATLNGNPVTPGPGGLTDEFAGQASNAFVSDVAVTANDPEVGVNLNAFPGSATTTISDITIREASAGALGSNTSICIDTGAFGSGTVANPDTLDFVTANATKVAGDASALSVTVTANRLRIDFSLPATRTAANTFKITGIVVDPADRGRILAQAGNCAATPTLFSPLTTLGAVVSQVRTGGSDRFQTARRIATERLGGSEAVILARADDFADALAASGLAGHLRETTDGYGPVLLTNTDSIPSATLNALDELGATTVYIVGGTQAVSQAVENQLRNRPSPGSGVFCPGSSTTECLRVIRIAGANRYATAREVADFIGDAGTVDLDPSDGLTATAQRLKTAFLARGDVFADALAVGPLAYEGTASGGAGDGNPMPILLTTPNALSPEAQAALVDLGIQQVVIAGGTVAVSQAVQDAVAALGIKVVRIAGANRQDTAAKVAAVAIEDSFKWPIGDPGIGGSVILATGANFPDALAAGPFGGVFNAPILLTQDATSLGAATESFLDRSSAVIFRNLHVVGLTAAVADAAADRARASLSGTVLA